MLEVVAGTDGPYAAIYRQRPAPTQCLLVYRNTNTTTPPCALSSISGLRLRGMGR